MKGQYVRYGGKKLMFPQACTFRKLCLYAARQQIRGEGSQGARKDEYG